MTILTLHEAQASNGPILNNVLIENDHSEVHDAQAPNGQFPNNVLIENDNSETPRGAGSTLVPTRFDVLIRERS